MPLALYGHPFSSYTQKALIALYENATPFEFREVGPEAPEHGAEVQRRSPVGKFPVLVDGERSVAEASIIIEYLQMNYPGPVRLIPDDPAAALEVRFMDRFFDLYVMDGMQIAVEAALGRVAMTREDGLALATQRLERAYGWLDGYLGTRTWAAGEFYSMADCAASMGLFYADWTYRIPERFAAVRAYRARLLARPSYARAVDEARRFRHFFPLGAPDRD